MNENQSGIQRILLQSQTSQIDVAYNESFKFVIKIDGFQKCKLSMKNDGRFLYPLREEKTNQVIKLTSSSPQREVAGEGNGETKPIVTAALTQPPSFQSMRYNMMYMVRTLYGRTKITFSSPLQIENNTRMELLVLVEQSKPGDKVQVRDKCNVINVIDVEGTKYACIFVLTPDNTFYVPLYVAYNW